MIQNVPTNIITGFLGVGKTSAILQLLKNKPQHERWAVLINEFGEIGVDGSLCEGQHSQGQEVFIREVPGGCMCCASGLPMQVALSQLLAKSKPDRLLIEPTGLGHPREVLAVLSSPQYQGVLSIQNTVTLVDARKLSDTRYTEHDTFNQQIEIADVIVGNKLDLYQPEDKDALAQYTSSHGQAHAELIFTEHANIDIERLDNLSQTDLATENSHTHQHHKHDHHDHDEHNHSHQSPKQPLSEMPIPDCGYVKAVNQGEGFYSIGWRFSPEVEFKHKALFSFLSGLSAERMKAVFITDMGVYGYNLTSDALVEVELDDCWESKIEIIAKELDDSLEQQLMACIAQ